MNISHGLNTKKTRQVSAVKLNQYWLSVSDSPWYLHTFGQTNNETGSYTTTDQFWPIRAFLPFFSALANWSTHSYSISSCAFDVSLNDRVNKRANSMSGSIGRWEWQHVPCFRQFPFDPSPQGASDHDLLALTSRRHRFSFCDAN